MKNIIFAISLLFAAQAHAYNTEYFPILSGRTAGIDVTHKKGTLSLKWDLHSTNGFTLPTAKVLEEKGGFRCQIKNTLLLFSGYSIASRQWSQSWEIQIDWMPGTDASSCLIQVDHPDQGRAFAVLKADPRSDRPASEGMPDDGQQPPCESYECNGGGRGSNPGGPDDTSDGSSRGGDGGGFDGGGYGGGGGWGGV